MNADSLGFLGKLRKRRRIIVDPKLQVGLAVRVALATSFVLGAIGMGLFAPLVEAIDDRSDLHAAGDTAAALLYLHGRFWALAGVCLTVAVLATLAISHRIAGPLVRVKRHMSMVGSGQLPGMLRTRHGDFLKNEVAALNDMVGELGARFDDLHAARERIATHLETCRKQAADAAAPADLQHELLAAAQELDELRSLLMPRRDTPRDLIAPPSASAARPFARSAPDREVATSASPGS